MYLLDRRDVRLFPSRGDALALVLRRILMLVRRSRHLCTSHIEGCRRGAWSLERRRGGGLRMLLRRVCLILMRRLLVCGIIRQERHLYIHHMTLWRSNLVRERECRISEDLVEVVVEGSLGLWVHRSLGALAAVEDLALDNPGLEDLHTPGVLLVAWRTACSWTVVDVTWRIRVRPHSPCAP